MSRGRFVATILLSLFTSYSGLPAAERERAVVQLGTRVITLHSPLGDASLPVEASADLNGRHPEGRNVEGYYHALQRAAEQAGSDSQHSLLLAPQFLREEDVEAHHLAEQFLRWHADSWTAGEPALGPMQLSTFEVIDELLAILDNRPQFPNLRKIVLVGHSAGGQLLNRYAIVGSGIERLAASGVGLRFVIANPSSYLYFSDDRPLPNGSFAPFRSAACPGFNHWRYGSTNAPSYVVDTSPKAWDNREQRYAAADVVYLLGTDDTDPAQADLDTSCAGEAQGPERLDRGKAYFRYLKGRHADDLRQQLWLVPGVGHTGSHMVDSPCGIAAIFDHGRCADRSGNAK